MPAEVQSPPRLAPPQLGPEDPALFAIKISGVLKTEWSRWFDGLKILCYLEQDQAVTMLTGRVADQAALRGILNRVWDLNLTVISVFCLGKEP